MTEFNDSKMSKSWMPYDYKQQTDLRFRKRFLHSLKRNENSSFKSFR